VTKTQTKIIGLSGTNGSGKDTVGHMLTERHGYLFISLTDMLRKEAKKRGLSVDRETLRTISAEWRRENGLGVLIEKALEHLQELDADFRGLVVASLRNPGEADKVHELGGTVVWVDADPRTRYDRIQAHAAERDRAEEDNKTFEQFLAEEAAEMTTSGDKATLNMSAVRERADLTIANNGNDVRAFCDQAEQALAEHNIL
jgi:dephospho-CoA kinase